MESRVSGVRVEEVDGEGRLRQIYQSVFSLILSLKKKLKEGVAEFSQGSREGVVTGLK